jgi:hypothetical protein
MGLDVDRRSAYLPDSWTRRWPLAWVFNAQSIAGTQLNHYYRMPFSQASSRTPVEQIQIPKSTLLALDHNTSPSDDPMVISPIKIPTLTFSRRFHFLPSARINSS